MSLLIFLSIIVTGLLFVLYLGLGELVLRLCRIERNSSVFLLLCRIGLGFGAVGNVIMVLCFLRCARPPAIIGVTAALFLGSLFYVKQPLAMIFNRLRLLDKSVFAESPVPAAVLALLIAGYFCRGLLPPVEFDTLMYHLATAKLYLQHGGFWHIYFNAQSDFPLLTEMNYLIGLALGNDIICKTLSAGIGFAVLAVIAVVGKTYIGCSRHQILVALLIFCTFTCTIANMATCYVDIPQALWTVLAVLALESYLDNKKTGMLVVSGLFAGMAMQTKVFGVFVLPMLLVRRFVAARGDVLNREAVRDYALVVFIGISLALPWYLKSYVHNGTILSITHTSIVGQGLSRPMDIAGGSPLVNALVNVAGRIFAAPWTFSIFPGQHQSDTFGPLLLCILPFLVFTGVPGKARFLLIAAGIYFAEILALEMGFIQGGSSIRYSTVILIIAAPFIPYVVGRLSDHRILKTTFYLMVVLMILLGAALFFKRYHKEWLALAKNQSWQAYYTAVLPEYPVIDRINKLNDGKVVMPIYNYTDYLIDVPFITAYRHYSDSADMVADFKKKNIGYIFANDKLDTAGNATAFSWLKEKECVASKNGFYLYRLKL